MITKPNLLTCAFRQNVPLRKPPMPNTVIKVENLFRHQKKREGEGANMKRRGRKKKTHHT
jgi:hypothetical protein